MAAIAASHGRLLTGLLTLADMSSAGEIGVVRPGDLYFLDDRNLRVLPENSIGDKPYRYIRTSSGAFRQPQCSYWLQSPVVDPGGFDDGFILVDFTIFRIFRFRFSTYN